MTVRVHGNLVRRLGGLLIAGSAVVVLAGCGSDDAASSGTTAADGASAGASKSLAEPADAKELVLPGSELPKGFVAQEIPAGQLELSSKQILEAAKAVQLSPASCKQLSVLPDSVDLSKTGVTVAAKGGASLSISVTPGDGNIAAQRKSLIGKCADIEMLFTTGEMAGIAGQVKHTIVKAPTTKVKADQTLVVQQNNTMKIEGRSVTTRARMGFADVNGYQVAVQYIPAVGPGAPGAEADFGAFDEAFVAAVNRVVDGTH